MVLYWSALSWRLTTALSLNKGALEPKLALLLEKGEYSLTELTLRSIIASYSALLLPLILEGVIGLKPRGDTREKQRTICFLGWAFRTQIRRGRIIQRTKI